MTRLRGSARGLSHVIAVATAVWCLGLLARAVETSCVIAGMGVVDTPATPPTAGAPAIHGVGGIARDVADLLSMPSGLAIGALAFLAVGSVLIVHRSRSERAGATFIALAVWGSLALSQTEIRAILEGNGHTVWHLAARVGIVVGSLALTWRWIEDIALAASLLPNDDPHPVDRATDEEATHVATLGPSGRGSASRQLSSALGIRERSHGAIADPGLSGRGSPIPRVMPTHDDEPQPASSGV